MTRMSIEMPGRYPRRFLWWFQCDRCEVPQEPSWTQTEIDLQKFADEGWAIGKRYDTCPACLANGVAPDEPLATIKKTEEVQS